MNTMQTFDELMERHSRLVLRRCASTLGPGPDAEDAAAETFLAALRAFPFADDVNVEAWLVRVARNKSVDILRARRRTDVVDTAELATDHEQAAHDASFDDELWGDVAQLSARQQYVVAHRFIAQWTYPEIADVLGCTPAAARRTGSDAIAALRRRRAAREENS